MWTADDQTRLRLGTTVAIGRWQARDATPAGERTTAPETFRARAEAASYLAASVEADIERGSWLGPVVLNYSRVDAATVAACGLSQGALTEHLRADATASADVEDRTSDGQTSAQVPPTRQSIDPGELDQLRGLVGASKAAAGADDKDV